MTPPPAAHKRGAASSERTEVWLTLAQLTLNWLSTAATCCSRKPISALECSPKHAGVSGGNDSWMYSLYPAMLSGPGDGKPGKKFTLPSGRGSVESQLRAAAGQLRRVG